MSARAVEWALGLDLPSTKKLLLVTVSWIADDAGVTWRGQDTIGARLGKDGRWVREHLGALCEAGYVTRFRRHTAQGRRTSDLLVVNMPRDHELDLSAYSGIVGDREEGDREPTGGNPPGSDADLPAENGTPTGGNPPTNNQRINKSSETDVSEIARDGVPSSMTYRGRKVPRPVVDVAARSVRYFASKTGQSLRVVDGTGRASMSLQRVVGAMLAHPELADPDFARRTIDFALAAPWWRDEGPPGVGVVFGPNVVERMVEQARRDEPPAPRGPSNGRPSASDLLRMLDE